MNFFYIFIFFLIKCCIAIYGFVFIFKNMIYYSPLWILYSIYFSFIIMKFKNEIINFNPIKMEKNNKYSKIDGEAVINDKIKSFSYGLIISSLFSFLFAGGINSFLLSILYFCSINNIFLSFEESSFIVFIFIIFCYFMLLMISNFFNVLQFVMFCLHYLFLFFNFSLSVLLTIV